MRLSRFSITVAMIVGVIAGRFVYAADSRSVTLQGVVFHDQNNNGIRDTGETALNEMSVSNGVDIIPTDAEGRFSLTVHENVSGSVFVSTPTGWRASRQFWVNADFDQHAGKTQAADIGLVRDPARAADQFCFVQLTDTHVTDDTAAIQTMAQGIQVVNQLTDVPVFVVTTGDLVNRGKRTVELEGYMEGIRNSRYPLYNVPGNHDYGGKTRATENYERIVGPRYYSFDVGRYHFIARDAIAAGRDEAANQRQQAWIEKDLQRNAQNKRVIIFQHFLPTNDELEFWSKHHGAGVFSGHWHGRRERLYKGVLDVNSAPARFGGIDRSPRGFRIIHIDGDDIRCEWRVGQQNRRVHLVHPQADGLVARGNVNLRVLAYDTAVRVQNVNYKILDQTQTKPIAQGKLSPESAWSWVANWHVPANVAPGRKKLQVQVTGADGTTWQTEGDFTLTDTAAPRPVMGENWPFFHGDAGHRGYVKAGPQPPLSLAWATHVGGTIHLASPVIENESVYIGTGFHESLNDCTMTALDLKTGRPRWRYQVDSSIKHSLACYQGNILAASQAGTLYCLDNAGQKRWTASLAAGSSKRWEQSFPVTDGQRVYAGRSQGFGAFDLASGKPIWNRDGGRDWWPSVYSGPSLGTGLVYQGGPFVRALNPDTGDVRWENKKMAVSTVAVVPAVVERSEKGDRLYVFHNRKTLRCLDGQTGKTIWEGRFDPDAPIGQGELKETVPLGDETGTPAVGENIVCVGSANVTLPGDDGGTAAMHGFDKTTGKLLWRFTVEKSIVSAAPYKRDEPTISSSPVIVGNVVYFGAMDGRFYALDAKTGKPLWQYNFGVPIASTVAVTGNTLIVAAWDGTVYAMTGSK